jgi:hypothetical protein
LPSWAAGRRPVPVMFAAECLGRNPRGTLLLVYLPVSAWKGVPQPLILND